MRLFRMLLQRRFYEELDYARNLPKAYVDRVKKRIPLKDFDNRFGAPKLTVWELPPEEHIDVPKRPWESEYIQATYRRNQARRKAYWGDKFFKINHRETKAIDSKDWTIFPGDKVEVMVGKDKGRQGYVSHVIREQNTVYVDGLHTKLEKQELGAYQKKFDLDEILVRTPLPLDVSKGTVKLVDPNDGSACEAEWILKEGTTDDWVRRSTRTKYEIPLPSQAFVTYDYVSKDKYIECESDTTADEALKITYKPVMKTFEQELLDEYGIKEERKPLPTYWY